MNKAAEKFAVGYRTGGTSNFKWNRVLEVYGTREDAADKARELATAGYPSLVYSAALLDAIGLPETFDMTTEVHKEAEHAK